MKPVAYSRHRFRLGAILGAPIVAAFLVNGCLSGADRDPVSPAMEDPSASLDPAKGVAALEAMGYHKDHIRQVDGGFIVEGDMFYRLADLAGPRSVALGKSSQRQYQPISSPFPQFVSVSMHPSLKNWFPIVSQAVANWNAVNTRLRLRVSQGGPASIQIYSDTSTACPAVYRNLPDNIGGIATAASGGNPGSQTCINMDASAMTSDAIRVMVVTHELGHTIGFSHTNGASGTQIPGTPVTDNSSIMGTSGSFTNVLSAEDMKALEILYPSDIPLGGSDLDGDSKDDIPVWRPSTGTWHVLTSASGFVSGTSWQWGQRGDVPVADMDLNSDGRDDKVVWRPSDGSWRILHTLANTTRTILFGQIGDVPVANHDVDGDNRDDLVLWRWKEAKFHWRSSITNYASGGSFSWGALGDIPVGGVDADQDGKDDWVVWRPADTKFHVAFSSTGFTTSQAYTNGLSGDIPVGGTDSDRDGKDDLALFSGATWFSLLSGGNFATQRIVTTGHAGAVPLIGTDIDQDGLRDLVVWNPSSGTWVIKNSSTNFATTTSFVWGQ